ncbi:hypothetical protein ACU686_10265 [Yinghuangia aomiensis]
MKRGEEVGAVEVAEVVQPGQGPGLAEEFLGLQRAASIPRRAPGRRRD